MPFLIHISFKYGQPFASVGCINTPPSPVRMVTLPLITFAEESSRTLEIFLRVKFYTIVLTSIYVNLDSLLKKRYICMKYLDVLKHYIKSHVDCLLPGKNYTQTQQAHNYKHHLVQSVIRKMLSVFKAYFVS